MNPNMNDLHGDHYGFGQENYNPTSSLTNAPKGKMVSDFPTQNSGLNTTGLGTNSSNSIDDYGVSNTINDHNIFAKNQNMAVSDDMVIPKDNGNIKIVLVIGVILLILIVASILYVLFLR